MTHKIKKTREIRSNKPPERARNACIIRMERGKIQAQTSSPAFYPQHKTRIPQLEDPLNRFQKRLMSLRDAEGWDLDRLASYLNVDRTTIRRWIAGTTRPLPKHYQRARRLFARFFC